MQDWQWFGTLSPNDWQHISGNVFIRMFWTGKMSIGVTMFCTFWSFELTAPEKFPTWLWLVRNHVYVNGVCMYDNYWVDLKLYDTTFIFVYFGVVIDNFGVRRGQGKCIKLSSFGETFYASVEIYQWSAICKKICLYLSYKLVVLLHFE